MTSKRRRPASTWMNSRYTPTWPLPVLRLRGRTSGGQVSAYRQLQFFRPTQGEWVKTTPDVRYWGPSQSMQTKHFTFRYRRRDASTIATVSTNMESAYVQLRQELELTPPTSSLEIEVDPAVARQNIFIARFKDGRLRMPSPSLFSIPVELSEEELLTQWLLDPLVRHMLDAAELKQPVLPQWRYIKIALHEWLIRKQNPLALAWHNDLIRWMYAEDWDEEQSSSDDKALALARLCAKHKAEERILLLGTGTASTHLCVAPSRGVAPVVGRDTAIAPGRHPLCSSPAGFWEGGTNVAHSRTGLVGVRRRCTGHAL